LPIVTSTNCGAREWVVQEKNGFVVDALDIDALAEALDRLCEWAGNAEHREFSCAAVAELTLSNMASRLLALYGRLQTAGGNV
jgi:UDP-glucose:(heptosyl)LPS alpha-1,3-glucosyltransferase